MNSADTPPLSLLSAMLRILNRRADAEQLTTDFFPGAPPRDYHVGYFDAVADIRSDFLRVLERVDDSFYVLTVSNGAYTFTRIASIVAHTPPSVPVPAPARPEGDPR